MQTVQGDCTVCYGREYYERLSWLFKCEQQHCKCNDDQSDYCKNNPLKCFLTDAVCHALPFHSLFTGESIPTHSITTFLKQGLPAI